MSNARIANVSRSGATAKRPAETVIAHRLAGRASPAPTIKCVIAEAMLNYGTVQAEPLALNVTEPRPSESGFVEPPRQCGAGFHPAPQFFTALSWSGARSRTPLTVTAPAIGR